MQENVTKQKKDDEEICGHCLPMHMGSAKSDDQSCSIPGTLSSRRTHRVNT
jgi:hypothetical protein